MNLQTTPFSKQEVNKKYQITAFEESGIKINVLNEINTSGRKLPSGNCYKFGVIISGQYFWYFNGEPVKKIQEQRVDRAKMREIYSVLLGLNSGTDNVPFTFKVSR